MEVIVSRPWPRPVVAVVRLDRRRGRPAPRSLEGRGRAGRQESCLSNERGVSGMWFRLAFAAALTLLAIAGCGGERPPHGGDRSRGGGVAAAMRDRARIRDVI